MTLPTRVPQVVLLFAALSLLPTCSRRDSERKDSTDKGSDRKDKKKSSEKAADVEEKPKKKPKVDAKELAAPVWEATRTYAVVAGVLSWADPAFSAFPKEHRKDEELFELLGKRGVPASQRVLLLDDKATTQAILDNLDTMVAKVSAGDTFIFYFAGHGVKADSGKIVFASSDIKGSSSEKTGLLLDEVSTRLAKLAKLKGVQVMLLADCCYSGGLAEVARTLGKAGISAVSLTSADASNTSTRNWTYTQSVIDAFGGNPICDVNGNSEVSFDELEADVSRAMKFRESQRYGYENQGVPTRLVLGPTEKCPSCERPEPTKPYGRGSYVTGLHSGEKTPARVLGSPDANTLTVSYYDYSETIEAKLDRKDAKPIVFKEYPTGSKLSVTWEGKTWEAKVLKVDSGFHYITYPGWPAYWDEWVTDSRIVGLR